MRERLIELIKESFDKPKYEFYTGGRNCAKGYVSAETIADYLLDNGVIVPPCKVGDTVWAIEDNDICENKMTEIFFNTDGSYIFSKEVIGKLVFFTKGEAEVKLKELKGE